MPWKDGYTISNERTVPDGEIRWPRATKCLVRVTVDLCPDAEGSGLTPAGVATGDAVFAMGAGLDALSSCLETRGITATFVVPTVVARLYPDRIRKLAAAGHEIAATMPFGQDPAGMDEANESSAITEATGILADLLGARPAGWFSLPRASDAFGVGSVSVRTHHLLMAGGYSYFGNSPADDLPHYWVTDPRTGRCILALPYNYHMDDRFFCLFPRRGTGIENSDVLLRNWKCEFDALYRRGRAFEITVNPGRIAWGNRMAALEALLNHLAECSGVAFATAQACAIHWMREYPPEEVLSLSPEVWKSYPDSLN